MEEEEHKLHLERKNVRSDKKKYMLYVTSRVFGRGEAGAYQLQRRDVFLPPQVFLHVWADSCQAIVRVHHDVDEGVHHADEECLQGVTRKGKNVKAAKILIKLKLNIF